MAPLLPCSRCYLQQIIPVFPFKPVNAMSGGNFGTLRQATMEDVLTLKASETEQV